MSRPAGAVFLSYASQDAEVAKCICEALRAGGIEVWFDQSELRGGDAWDRQIRRQIHDCALFVAIISTHSDARKEGYFRREWKLAVERTADMADDVPFLLPVVIDGTTDATARVPDRFREVQWSHLFDGEVSTAFVERVQRLLSAEASTVTWAPGSAVPGATPAVREQAPATLWSKRFLPMAAAVVILGAVGYLTIDGLRTSKLAAAPPTAPAVPPSAAPTAFDPPPHSIAVLPFVNLSGDKEQEYFSDGLTEELLNSLAEIDGLQVAARTSSFSFREHPDVASVAHKLNVATVLEGSVRRSANTVRVTAQLINAVTGFHQWSKTYDRDVGNVLKLQTEIATAVATALKVTMLGDIAARIELGGTHNPAAFDAYLRGSRPLYGSVGDEKGLESAIGAFTEAIRLDPNYALAFAGRSLAYSFYVGQYSSDPAAIREGGEKALSDAHRSIALAPELAEGYRALALFEYSSQQFRGATDAFKRALTLAPGDARVLTDYGRFTVLMGHADAGIAVGRRALVLDRLNPRCHHRVGEGLFFARHYEEAVAAFDAALALEPDNARTHGFRGLAYYALGDLQSARASCEVKSDNWVIQVCLAVVYGKLGQHADAEAVLAKFKASARDSSAYQYATIYAQWGNTPKSLEWLETALRVHDPGFIFMKTDPLMDPVRKEPRFQAIERQLKFPD